MATLIENLLNESRNNPNAASEAFKPVARYYPALDFMLYLNEDCSYRADRVDAFLTVLWHPHKEHLVGIKLKGFKVMFNQLKKIADLKDEHFLPLIKILELAAMGGLAEQMMRDQKERVLRLYDRAREIAKGAQFDSRDLYQEAA